MYDADASEIEQMKHNEIYRQQHRPSSGSRPTGGNHGVGHLEEKPSDTPKHSNMRRS